MRARLLRRIGIAHRRCVLDLGAGYGAVTAELARRSSSSGRVVALDLALSPLRSLAQPGEQVVPQAVCANGVSLPFADATFDMVYCQLVLLWAMPIESVIREMWRVLQPGGVVIAVEPDYGGMIEYPTTLATRDLWIAALKRAGANPTIGRMLPSMFERHGFRVRVDLLPELVPPSTTRFALLRGLPLTNREYAKLRHIEQQDAAMGDSDDGQRWARVVHLPFVLITAERLAE